MSCIEAIFATNFRGQTFHDELDGNKHLFTAPVGTGKSTRVNALQLLTTGSVPAAGLSKKIGDIMTAMCPASEDEMRVGARIAGTNYERVIRRTKTGGATQKFHLNGEAVSKSSFEMSLFAHGIRIADLQSFVELSEEKKQQHLFSLFPPSGDVQELNKQLNDKKELLKKLKSKTKEQKEIVKSLKTSRATLNLPAKTLPEIENEIASRKVELEEFQKDMAEQKGRMEAEKQANEATISKQETVEPQPQPEVVAQPEADPFSMSNPETAQFMDRLYAKTEQKTAVPEPKPVNSTQNVAETDKKEAVSVDSTQLITAAMDALGKVLATQECAGMCAVNLVYKQQLKKLKKAGLINE